MEQRLLELVIRCVQEVASLGRTKLLSPLGPETILFGADGLLDSMGLVNLVILVEQYVADEHGASITLADRRALSLSNSPFRTVRSLASYAEALLKEAA